MPLRAVAGYGSLGIAAGRRNTSGITAVETSTRARVGLFSLETGPDGPECAAQPPPGPSAPRPTRPLRPRPNRTHAATATHTATASGQHAEVTSSATHCLGSLFDYLNLGDPFLERLGNMVNKTTLDWFDAYQVSIARGRCADPTSRAFQKLSACTGVPCGADGVWHNPVCDHIMSLGYECKPLFVSCQFQAWCAIEWQLVETGTHMPVWGSPWSGGFQGSGRAFAHHHSAVWGPEDLASAVRPKHRDGVGPPHFTTPGMGAPTTPIALQCHLYASP